MQKRLTTSLLTLTLAAGMLAFTPAQARAAEAELTPAAFDQCTGVYRLHSQGFCPRLIQTALKRHGFDPGPIDGIYGSRTAGAAAAFQRAKGLQVDSVVGPRTMAELRKLPARPPVQPPSTATFRDPMTVVYKMGDRYGTVDRASGHGGIDLAPLAPWSPAPVVAAAAGTVRSVTWESTSNKGKGWGLYILIDHAGGLSTLYAHLKEGSPTVKPGDRVEAGQVIAQVGSTGRSSGPHLHLEVWKNGVRQNPQDYIRFTYSR